MMQLKPAAAMAAQVAPRGSLYARLASIADDAGYVRAVASALGFAAIFPNLRCGLWYCPPDVWPRDRLPTKPPVYFMSKDGHPGKWTFSLRRLNLQLFEAVLDAGGATVVDSTGRGKAVPDSFSKVRHRAPSPVGSKVLKLLVSAQTSGRAA